VSLLDIHANITYSVIAPLLGLEPLPKYTVAAECPYCGAHAWAIYQDNRNLEEWHYCSQCKATGSIIAMAAERLEMTEIETVRYLAEQLNRPLDFRAIENYRSSLDLNRRYRQLWDHARERMRQPTDEELKFLSYLGWHQRSAMSIDRIMDGPAQLYGLAEAQAARTYLRSVSNKSFRKREVLAVVPFYKTPTAIGGFACFSPTRTIFTNNGTHCETIKGDTGFAGLQFIHRVQSETVIVTSMVTNMIQLQMHHFSSNMTPLPVLSWRQSSVSAVQRQWAVLDGRKIILWEREPTAAMLHQALMSNANISFVGPTTKRQQPREVKGQRWKAWIRHDPAIDICRRIVSSSRPYRQALKNWARLATPQQKIKLLQDAEAYEEHTSDLVRSVLSPKVGVCVGRRVTVGTSGNRDRPGHSSSQTVVIERDGKWYNQSGKVRFPGIMRVTHIVVRTSGEQEYVGYLKVDGQKFDFVVPKKQASMAWICRFGTDNGAFMQTDHYKTTLGKFQSENFNPFEAAMRYEVPQMVKGLDHIGWDGSGFQLKGARLFQGVFHSNPEFKLPADVPGPKQSNCKLREEVKTALQKDGVEMEIVWAMAIALCAQITAPAVELHPFGIWIHRQKCDLFLQTLYNRFEIWRGDYIGWKHLWPRRLDRWHGAVEKDDTGFFVTHYQLRPPAKVQELLVVEANDSDLQPRAITHSADKIILNYLRHFTRQTHEFPGNWENWKNYTVEQMKEAFSFVDTAAFREASDRVKAV
jgi:hypothetical protein